MSEFKCECGRICKSPGGLTNHRNKCDTFHQLKGTTKKDKKSTKTCKEIIPIQIEQTITTSNKMDSKTNIIIDQIQQLLYGNGITGEKAMNDTIRLIFLKVNSEYLTKLGEEIKDTELYKLWLDEFNISKDSYKLLNWSYFNSVITEYNGVKALLHTDNNKSTFVKEIGMMLKSDSFTKKFFKTENWINLTDNITLAKIITLINTIDTFKEQDTNGSIYEFIINGYLKSGGKLGQFFTPRPLVEMLINEVKNFEHLNELDTLKIYDPCMGTAGFLQRLGEHYTNKKLIIYGSEIEPDTLMYGLMNLLIYNNVYDINVECENSLFADKKVKFDIILTNPPYGINTDTERAATMKCYLKKGTTDLITSDSSGLFTLKCAKMLAKGGVCCIVLPYGELFTSTDFIEWRQYLMRKYNITKIIINKNLKFTYTTINTANLIFTTGITKKIEFVNKDEIICVDVDDLYKIDTWNIKSYRTKKSMMDKSFKYTLLKDICDIRIGGTPKRTTMEYYDNGTNLWVSIRDLNNDILYDTKEKITDLGVKNSNVKLYDIGTILFSFKLTIGKVAIAGVPLYSNEAIAGINTLDSSIILNKYIYYYLQYTDFTELANGIIGKGSLNKEIMKNINIPLISIDYQNNIINIIDSYNNIIYTSKKLIADIKKSMSGVFKNIKKNIVNTILKDICDIRIGGTPLRKNLDYFTNGTHLWTSIRDLNYGILYDTKEKITDLGVKNSSVKLYDVGTVLFSFKLTIGKMAIAGLPLYSNEAIAGMNTLDSTILLNKYLYYYLQYTDFTNLTGGIIGEGSLNKEIIKNIIFPLPSLDTQNEIITILDADADVINTLKLTINRYTQKIKDYMKNQFE